MLTKIKSVFNIIAQVIAIYTLIVSLVELNLESEEGEEKKKKAVEWLQDVGKGLLEEKKISLWVYDTFFDGRLIGWIVDVMVAIANRLGFFRE